MEFWDGFVLEAANAQMEEAFDKLKAVACKLHGKPLEQAVQDIAVEYTRLFIGPGTPPAPLWESLYCEGGRYLFGQPTFDMREEFRKHGFRLNETAKQFEDHLGVELLFLGAMSERFPQAAPSAEAITEQIAFLDAHPLWWVGERRSRRRRVQR